MLKTRWYSIAHEPQIYSCLKWKIFKLHRKGVMRKVRMYCPC